MSFRYILVKTYMNQYMQLLAEVYFIRKCLIFASWRRYLNVIRFCLLLNLST